MPVPASLFLLAAAAAQPAPTDGAAARLSEQLFACRAIPDDAARLACFDRAAAALSSARDRNEVVMVDRDDIRRTRRSLFGFALPHIDLFGGNSDDKRDEIKEIDTQITDVRQHRDGMWGITLTDGSVWSFTEEVFLPPKSGDHIRIRRGVLGSYMGSVQGRIGARIRRDR